MGRLLLITEPTGNYFIDIKENIRHEWKLTSPKVIANPEIFSAKFDQLRIAFIAKFIATPNLDVFSGFPYTEQQVYNMQVYAWRAVYENASLGLRSFSEDVYVSLSGSLLQKFLDWLYTPNINGYSYRYKALLALGIINSSEHDLIENIQAHRTFTFDLSDAPTWATNLSIYRGELPETVLSVEETGETFTRSSSTYEVLSILAGTTAIIAGVFVANPLIIKAGAAFVISGLNSVIAEDIDKELKTYTLNTDLVADAPDEVYMRWHIEDIRIPLQHRKLPTTASDYIAPNTPFTFDVDYDQPNRSDIFLDARYNLSPPENMTAMIKHAGRIYAVDKDTQEIVFSHIDGEGVSQWLAFPLQNRFPIEESGTSEIIALEQMPDRGGIYVFKRDAIHFIEGRGLFSGLYDVNVSAQTDIDASKYKENIGCISPDSIINNGSVVLFVGTDDQIYTIVDSSITPIGLDIKPFIRELTIEEKELISASWYKERFYITLKDSTLLLDTERKFWLRYDWNLSNIYWDRGKSKAQSKLYGLSNDHKIMELNIDRGDEVFPIMLETNIQLLPAQSNLNAVYVYTDDNESVKITVEGNEPKRIEERTFKPRLGNKYMTPCYVKGRQVKMKLECEKPINIDRLIMTENIK